MPNKAEDPRWCTVVTKVDEVEISKHMAHQDTEGFSLVDISYYKSPYDKARGFGEDCMVAVMIFQRKGPEKMAYDKAIRDLENLTEYSVILQKNDNG